MDAETHTKAIDNSPDVSMEDMLLSLLYDLDMLSKMVQQAKTETENQPSGTWDSFIKNTGRAHDLALALSKKIHLDFLLECLGVPHHIVEPQYPAYFEQEFKEKINGIIQDDEKLINTINSDLACCYKNIDELKKHCDELENMKCKYAEKVDEIRTPDWKKVCENCRKKRLLIIRDLNYLEENLFKNSNISTILRAALKAVESGEPYVSVEKEWMDEVEFLLRCNVLIRHPHDESKVRIVDVL